MSITVKCANCGHVNQAPKTAMGKRINCARCGIMIFLPRPSSDDMEFRLADDTESTAAAAQLEKENREFERMLRESESDVKEPTYSQPEGEMSVFEIEHHCIDALTGLYTGDESLTKTALEKLSAHADKVPGVLKGLDVSLLLDSPLTELPPPVLKRFKGLLLRRLGLPASAAD